MEFLEYGLNEDHEIFYTLIGDILPLKTEGYDVIGCQQCVKRTQSATESS